MSDELKAQDCELEYWNQQAEDYAQVQIPCEDLRAIINRAWEAPAFNSALTAAEARAEAAVERVARAINPRAWEVMDHELRKTQEKYAGQRVSWPVSQFQHKESMDQARAAISALRQCAAMDALLRMDGELYDVPKE